jgi:beta-lactamase class A
MQPFSPALATRLSTAGTLVVGEALTRAPRPEPPRPEAPPLEPVADLAALRGDLEGAAGRHMGRYGVVVFDPDSRGGVSVGGDEVFTAASVGKLPTLLALYREAARGELDLDDKISIRYEDYRSYGTGVLHNFAPGTEMTLRECAYYLVNKSDNTAWEMLDRHLGVENIQAELEGIGATGTDYGMGTTTPKDIFLMLEKISDPSFTDGELSGEMISAMTNTAFEDRIPAPLPPETRVAHKIGSYEDSFGDAGVVFYEDRDGVERRYFIVVLSGGTAEGSARAAMQEMSLTAYEHLALPRR